MAKHIHAKKEAAPLVVVYVDQYGTPVKTVTENEPAPTPVYNNPLSVPASDYVPPAAAGKPQSVPVRPKVPVVAPVAPAGKPIATAAPAGALAVPVANYKAPAPPAAAPVAESVPVEGSADYGSSPSEGSSSPSTGVAPSSGGGFGFTYSAYNADGTCKSYEQIAKDFAGLDTNYAFVRTYGVDCNQVANVLRAAKERGMKLFQGIFDINEVDSAVKTIVTAVNGDWSSIHTVSVGNELVNNGAASAGTVLSAVRRAREQLRAAGYNGPVVTVDTLVATVANPALCDESDYCAVNSHPFFDSLTEASNAGQFLITQMANLKAKLADQSKQIVICEAGWPSQGEANGAAVPSPDNQKKAIDSMKSAFSSNPSSLVLFNPYNMHWKKSNAGQFNAEPWWGYLGDCPSG